MEQKNIVRPFDPADIPACIAIVNAVWGFDLRYKPPALAELFKKSYTGGALAASNFHIVTEENNAVTGFLFGKLGNKNLFINEFSGISGSLRFLFQLLAVRQLPFKKKTYYLSILAQHEANRRKIEPCRDNEINLFAVHPNLQGKGHGKQLMMSFIQYCRHHGVSRLTLDTDNECNRDSYRHFGFTVKGTFFSPLQQDYSGNSGESFVYELILTDPAPPES